MNKDGDRMDAEALAEYYRAQRRQQEGTTAVNTNGGPATGPEFTKGISPDGLRLSSKAYRLRAGNKIRGESKLARRMRRRGVVG